MTDILNVNGVAIHSGISRNGIMYTGEELKKSRKTLQGVPFQKDHDSSVDKSIGIVTKASFDEESEKTLYNGWIKEDGTNIIEKVKDRRVKAVSVGAMVERMVKEEEDSDILIAKGIHFVELSLVSVPGIPGATIQQALKMHETAKTPKEKAKIPAISEELSKFISLEQWKEVQEKKLTKETSSDARDGHTHTAVYDSESGDGATTLNGGDESEPHKHTVTDFKVLPETGDGYTSKHLGKLATEGINGEMGEKMVKEDNKNNVDETSEVTESVTEEKLNKKVDEEVIKKMEQEKMKEMQETLKAQNEEMKKREEELKVKGDLVQQKEADMEAKEKAEAKARKETLVEKYKKLTEEKKVDAKENAAELSEEMLNLLVEQLESIKIVAEEKVTTTKGVVGESKVDEGVDDSYKVGRSDFGRGYALFKENYQNTNLKRLKR